MASPHNSSFADKLRSLGVKTGTAHLAPPKPGSRYGIDSVVAGSFLSTPRGNVFAASQSYNAEYRHGYSSLLSDFPFSVISQCARYWRISDLIIYKVDFLDTENSALSCG